MVTTEKIQEATEYLKSHKNDSVFDFNSDCLKHAPSILFEHLASLVKRFLVHGHVIQLLMLATLVPIMKDKLGNIYSIIDPLPLAG